MNVVDILDQKRVEAGMNDQEFARQLGIAKSHWCMLKKGSRRPGRKLILQALQHFPEIVQDAEKLEIFLR